MSQGELNDIVNTYEYTIADLLRVKGWDVKSPEMVFIDNLTGGAK